jgi:diguanylate cyclase (GGDEF)-like protein
MRSGLPRQLDRVPFEGTPRVGIALRFPRALERGFEAEAHHSRCRRLVWSAFLGLAIFDLFLFGDWQMTPDIFSLALFARLGALTPLALLAVVVVWFEPPVWICETLAASAAVLAAAIMLGLMLLSNSPYREGEHHALILIVLFVTVVQRLRFPYAVAVCLSCVVLHATALATIPEYPFALFVSSNGVLLGAVVLALVAAYQLERDARQAYLDLLQRRRANEELALLSRHDPLTGLGNRRALDEMLGEMERRAGDLELSVVLLDIDHFKLYNDAAGHPGGDVCLKRIAGILRSELRERGDLAYRYGGDELLVVLPGANLGAAVAIAERVRRATADAAIPHPALAGGAAIVTLSAGAASAPIGQGLRAAEIIAGADAALYAAKRAGRNQVWPAFRNALPRAVVDLSGRKLRHR